MSTTTIEDQLADIRRQTPRLQALAQTELAAERARIQRHLDALQQEEASVLAAARTPEAVEERLGQLKTRLAVAENSVAADVSDEWTTFAEAVEEELRSWDTYLERLQTSAAAKCGEGPRAGRGGDRRRPQPADRGGRAARTGARRRRAPGRSRGSTSARPATSSNKRPPNCPRSSTERSKR